MTLNIMHLEEHQAHGLQGLGLRQAAEKKARVASMPPRLTNNSTQPSIYSQPSRFSGSGSPPIIDFTEWADNFRGQRFGFSIPNDFPPEGGRFGVHPILPRNAKGSPHESRIDYSVLLNALRPLVDSQGKGLEDFLNVGAVEALQRQDQERLLKRSRMESGKDGNLIPCIDGVIGKPLSDVFLHASLPLSIAANRHFVPTIVVKCIEELNRTGLYQPQLFRRTPNFVRVEELVEIYDHRELPGAIRIARSRPNHTPQYAPLPHSVFGSQTSLHMETTENICALLRTFLQYLPEPILSSCYFEAIWNFCGVRQEAFQSNFHLPSRSMVTNHISGNIPSEELVRIYIAQIMLHLLPTPNFSLLVYLLSFFSQVVMVHEQNGLAIDDVASMFGAIVFGGATERIVSWADSKPRARGDIMMRWFLRRWRQIYHGLFPYDDEGRQSNPAVNTLSPVNEIDNNPKRQMSGYFGPQDPPTISAQDTPVPVCEDTEEVDSPRVITASVDSVLPLDHPVPPVQQGTPTKEAQPPQLGISKSSELASNYLEEIWPHLTSELRLKLNERMLDVMLEPLLTSTSSARKLTRQRSNSVPSQLKSTNQAEPALRRQLDLAKLRISELESWIRDNKRLLHDAIVENQRIKKDKEILEVRVKGLEIELELRHAKYKESEAQVRKGMEEVVEGMVRERDEARGIVSEIQRISGRVVNNGERVVGGSFSIA